MVWKSSRRLIHPFTPAQPVVQSLTASLRSAVYKRYQAACVDDGVAPCVRVREQVTVRCVSFVLVIVT